MAVIYGIVKNKKMTYDEITTLIGEDNQSLLTHKSQTIIKAGLYLPGPDFIDRIAIDSNRNIPTLCSLGRIFKTGRLSGTGYLSVLPVDQGVEHSAGASFSPNPIYFDPENIVKLALEGGCNWVLPGTCEAFSELVWEKPDTARFKPKAMARSALNMNPSRQKTPRMR